MAILGIINKFTATHGSKKIRRHEFKVEISFQGEIRNNFVGGIDYVVPKERLEEVLKRLDSQYLDDIVGRATNENITMYILNELRGLSLHSVKVYEREKQYAEVFSSEINFEDYPALLCFCKGGSLLFRGKPELAIEELNRAIELREDFAEAYNLRGRCHKTLGRYDLALPDYLKAVQIKPDFGEAYRNIGNAYYFLDKIDLMIPAFTRAIELMPDSALAYNNRGFAYQRLKEFELAIQDHSKAIELDPNYAESYSDRADAYDTLGKKELAKKDYAKAEELIKSEKDTYSGVTMY